MFSPSGTFRKNMFDNEVFVHHVYTKLEAEFQVVKKKEVNPVKYIVFLPFCYICIYKKNELDNDIFGSSLSEKDPYYVFSNFLFLSLFDHFSYFKRF